MAVVVSSEHVITMATAGKEVGLGRWAILRRIKAGEIPALKFIGPSGKNVSYRILRKDFDAWVAKITVNKDKR